MRDLARDAELPPGPDESYAVEELDRPEAMRLLRQARVGRIVYTDSALPAITPVNFVLNGQTVVFRTADGSRLARAVDGAVVAFEVDDVRHEPGPWWSVVVLGIAEVCRDVSELLRLEQTGVRPWVSGDRNCYVRIVPSTVTGRRLRAKGAAATA